MGSNNWANHTLTDGYGTLSNGVFIPTPHTLGLKILGGEFGNQLNGIEDYINSIIYYPITREPFDFNNSSLSITDQIFHTVTFTKIFSDIPAVLLANEHPVYRGFYMGKYDFNQNINYDFTDFEPYTNVLVYLPFYGYAELSVKDIYKKIVVFRLCIDFRSGQGTYYVYSTDIDKEYEAGDHTFLTSQLDDAILIGTYICQIGVHIPISTTGASDKRRDAILTVSKAAISLAASDITSSMPVSYSYSSLAKTDSTTVHRRNAATNRMRKTYEKETTTGTDIERYSYANEEVSKVNTIAQLAGNILSTFSSNPTVSSGGSPITYLGGTELIHIVIKKAKVIDIDETYNYLFGKPLGEIKRVSDISGFTTFINFKMERTGIEIGQSSTRSGCMTSQEYAMIQEIMTTGVYL